MNSADRCRTELMCTGDPAERVDNIDVTELCLLTAISPNSFSGPFVGDDVDDSLSALLFVRGNRFGSEP